MKQEMYNEIKQDIETLATKLDKPTKEIWRVLIRETYIKGVLCIVYILVGVLFIMGGLKGLNMANNIPLDDHSTVPTEAFMSYMISILILIGASISIISNFGDMVSKLFNPKYSAIMDVKNILSQPKKD